MPATIDEATAFPTTKQWDAKHGAYVIPRLTNFDGEFMAPGRTASPDYRHIQPIRTNEQYHDNSGPLPLESGRLCYLSQQAASRMVPAISAFPSEDYSAGLGVATAMPYTTTGIHLTGLSPESTFTFVATWYIQLCPLPWSGLSTMVQPSPAYDPRVYEIYTRVMRAVPLATYKDDNDFGTWFRKVLGLVKNLAGPVAGTLLPGSGPAIQAAVNAITEAAKRRRQPA